MGLLTLRRERIEPVGRLDDVLRRLPVHLPWTALLGVGEDGVPLLVDLLDPRVGPLLIAAAPEAGRLLLDTIRVSLVKQNRLHEMQIFWGTEREGTRSVGMVRVFALHDRRLEETLLHLADVAESREHGRLMGPVLVLLLDDLGRVLEADREALWALEYLLRRGTQQRVWVAAAVDEDDRRVRRWYRHFWRVVKQVNGCFESGKERFYPVEVW